MFFSLKKKGFGGALGGGEGEENGELEYNFVYLIETPPLFFS